MSAVGDTTPAVELAAFLVGGSLTAATHATKAGSRVIINTSPEPVSNWFTSLGEDFLVIAGIWTALTYPLVFVVFLILFIILMAWLLPKIWRGIKRIISTLRDFIKGNKKEALPALNSSTDTQNE